MRPVIRMCVGGIVSRLFDLHGLLDFLGDVRIHGTDHDRRESVSVHIDVGDSELGGQLNLRRAVSRSVASVGNQDPDVGEGAVDEEP